MGSHEFLLAGPPPWPYRGSRSRSSASASAATTRSFSYPDGPAGALASCYAFDLVARRNSLVSV